VSTSVLIALVVAVLAAVAVLLLVLPKVRSSRLRRRFGPEYDRIVAEADDRAAAERELRRRQQRHAELDLRPLPEERKRHYTAEWVAAQERFVDDPRGALAEADRLVTAVATERGYPTGDHEQRLADLSVAHAEALEHYRRGRETARASSNARAGSETATEDLRTALVAYRTLFLDLVGAEKITGAEITGAEITGANTHPGTNTTTDVPTEKGALR